MVLKLAERARPHRQDDPRQPDRRRPQPLLDLGDGSDLHVDRRLVEVVHDQHDEGERRARYRWRRLRLDPRQLLEGRMDPLSDILRLRRPSPDRFIEVERPRQALGPHLGLQEQEVSMVEVGVVANRPGIEVEDQLLVEVGPAVALRRAIAAEIIVDQRGLAGADHAQDAQRSPRERVVPEEGVEDRLVGMLGLGLLDPVLPGAPRDIQPSEDLRFLERRMIGPLGEDVRAKAAMDQPIDLEWPTERIPLGSECLDQRGVRHTHSHPRGEMESDADARAGIVAPIPPSVPCRRRQPLATRVACPTISGRSYRAEVGRG